MEPQTISSPSSPIWQGSEPRVPENAMQIAKETLLRWRSDPIAFVREIFGADPEVWQAQSMRAMVDHDRISIKSGHGVGKSTLLSWTLLWWLTTRYPSKVPTTAPTGHQLYDVLWSEAKRWIRKAPRDFGSQFLVKNDRIELSHAGSECFAVARTSRKEQPEALQGFHDENLLFLIEEASGIDDVVFETGHGALSTPGAKLALAGNPTRASGYFWRSHQPGSGFVRITVPCSASTRVSPAYIEEMAKLYGRDSNIYRVRVLGEFPLAEDDVLIPYHLVEAAVGRDYRGGYGSVRNWGLDVARFGDDDSALSKRHGMHLEEPPIVKSKYSTAQLVGFVKNEFERLPEERRPENIMVDVIGVGGGVVDRGQEVGLPMIGINVAESASMRTEGLKLRDEIWIKGKEWFETDLAVIPPYKQGNVVEHETIERLIGELTSVKYSFTSSGKIQVESKADMKKRGLRSPDVAESFLLTFPFENAVVMSLADQKIGRYRKLRKRQDPMAGIL